MTHAIYIPFVSSIRIKMYIIEKLINYSWTLVKEHLFCIHFCFLVFKFRLFGHFEKTSALKKIKANHPDTQ